MGKGRRPWSAVKRWWRSRGFGIHSPFAYDFITNTLRCHHGYYEYRAIEQLQPAVQPQLKLLLRVVCRLRPRSFLPMGALAHDAIRVVTSVDSSIVVATNSEHTDMLFISNHARYDTRQLLDCLNSGGTVLFDSQNDNRHAIGQLRQVMQHGMTFSNGKCFIAVGRNDLPRQHFELNF
ncbi:MAG: hypothetical protein NC082_02385 [Clostridiales bacterium]|nr:hypothetical protein [Clostridiales bacterium]